MITNSRIRQTEPVRLALPGILILAILFLGACASSGPSVATVDQSLTKASAAVSEAQEAGAQENAPLAFSEAQDKLQSAQKAKAEGDHEKALQLAEEAEVDAQYAQAKALSAKAEKAAEELQESIQTLREEINRKQSQ